MTETKIIDGVRVRIDTDGIDISDVLHDGNVTVTDDGVSLDFDQFEEIAEFLGYEQGYEMRKTETIAEMLGSYVNHVEESGGMDQPDIDENIVLICDGDSKLVKIIAGDYEFVGVVEWSGSSNVDNRFADVRKYRANIRPVGYDVPDDVEVGYQTVYEPSTRDYPGYSGAEDFHVTIDGETMIPDRVEVLE